MLGVGPRWWWRQYAFTKGVPMSSSSRAAMAIQSAVLGYIPYRIMRRRMMRAPFPPGFGSGRIPGPRPVLLAVIGEGTAIGYQTVHADLTVAAQLARRIGRSSGRGVHWQAMATPDFTIRTAQQLIRNNPQLIVVDVIVVLLGIGDALRFTPPRTWRHCLEEVLADLRSHLAPASVILVAEIPPVDMAHETPERMRPRISRHVQLLNEVTRDVTARTVNTVYVPFPTVLVHEFETLDGGETFYGRVYRAWASVMLQHIPASHA
jgi:lysophospholipase L1-like esterase